MTTVPPKRTDPKKAWPTLKHAATVYDAIWSGESVVEAARRCGVNYSRIHIHYRDVIEQARKDNPDVKAIRAAAKRLETAAGRGIDMAEVTRLAKLGLPDKLIAATLGLEQETLTKHCRKEIDLARALLAQELAEKIVAAAQGSHAALERILALLHAEQDKRAEHKVGDLSDATLQTVIEIMAKEHEKPNLLVAEKLLTRLGFYDQPLDSELRVRVLFDEDGGKTVEVAVGGKAAPVDPPVDD